MEPAYDNDGFLMKVSGTFGYGRNVSLTKWEGKLWLHIFDTSKCRQQNGSYDKTKRKSLSFKWADAVTLKDCLTQLDPYVQQIEHLQKKCLDLRNNQSECKKEYFRFEG